MEIELCEQSVALNSTDEPSAVSKNEDGATMDLPQIKDPANDFPQSLALLQPPNEVGDRADEEILDIIRKGFRQRQNLSYEGQELENSPEYIRVVPQDMRELLEATLEEQLHVCTRDEKEEVLRKIVEKTQQLNLTKSDAILEVYTDQFVANFKGDISNTLLWILNQEKITEYSVLIFITRLLDRGANPSHYDSNDKKTPLHLVATKGWTRVAYKLVEYGAYLGAKDSKNRTALEIAILEEHDDISQFLIKSMKPIRVRELFESRDTGEAKLSFNYMLKEKRIRKRMKGTILSILDCMMEPAVGQPNVHIVYYHILDGDHAGRAPSNPYFERKHKSCLQRIAKSGDKDIVYHDVVRLLLRRKWKGFVRFHFIIQCLVNLLFYIILNTALLLAAEKSDPRDYSQPVDKFRGVCEATYLLYVFWLIFGEVNQFRKHRLLYFYDPYNVLDVSSIVFPLLIIPFRIAHLEVEWVFASLTYLFTGFRLFKYVAAFRTTGAYVRILARIILIDIVQFSVIFILLLYAFSGAIYLALRGEGLSTVEQTVLNVNTNNSAVQNTPTSLDISPFETSEIYYIWLWGVRVMIEATNVLTQPYYGEYGFKWLGVLLYLIFLFMVVVVMLNMLIASMTDTFANVQTDAQRDLALARAWIVARVEHNSMLTLDFRKRTYVSIEVIENPQDILDKWELPPINEVSRTLQRVKASLKKHEDAIEKTKLELLERLTQQEKLIKTLIDKINEQSSQSTA